MRALIVLALGLAVASADRIIGGSTTTIDRYPFTGAMLLSPSGSGSFWQACGSSILNNRAVLTAAHCFDRHPSTSQWRIRVGSTNANSGGSVVTTNRIINHPSYNRHTFDNDISVLRINGAFSFNNNVRASRIAGANYNLADNQAVWAVGWGVTSVGGRPSEQLRHVQVWSVNQNTCRTRYAELGRTITANMLCAGWLDVGGRDACQGDSGGPLLHNNIVVGVCSWGERCALARYPGVNARVSRYTAWIQNNS
ncbi:trypsin, alkaline C-like [Vanessa atalanta]|uniref:trypsin, alkaline C-like n=1 Tax=Vanessa atalanta TaxID=42275 RepID=UPI001FCE2873|nr:trypsin, alkaline C-like [Vanessa atalanta]XP_047530063.1 trypsin, alkaline C-like [Vanessa atalanta]